MSLFYAHDTPWSSSTEPYEYAPPIVRPNCQLRYISRIFHKKIPYLI